MVQSSALVGAHTVRPPFPRRRGFGFENEIWSRGSMTKLPILDEIGKQFQLDVTEQEDLVVLKDRKTNAEIEVCREVYLSSDGEDGFLRYTVRFATQHRHFDCWQDEQGQLDTKKLREAETEVETYIRQILLDERLPIEFYRGDQRQFGGELIKDEYERLSVEMLCGRFGYSVDLLSQYAFEIHSWSGQFDIKRMRVLELPRRKG